MFWKVTDASGKESIAVFLGEREAKIHLREK